MESEIITNIFESSPAIFIAAVVAYYFSQRRYVFEKLHDKKLLYLEEVYSKVVSLEKHLKKYVLTTGSMTYESYLEDRKKELAPIQKKFFELQELFWKREIVFEQISVDSIQNFIDVSIKILTKLQASNISSQINDSKTSQEQWNDAYRTMQIELINAKQALKTNFRKIIES